MKKIKNYASLTRVINLKHLLRIFVKIKSKSYSKDDGGHYANLKPSAKAKGPILFLYGTSRGRISGL